MRIIELKLTHKVETSAHTLLLPKTTYERVKADLQTIDSKITLLPFDHEDMPSLRTSLTKSLQDPTIIWMSLDLYQEFHPNILDQVIKNSTNLKWVHTAIAGIEAPVFKSLLTRNVRLTNSDAQASSVADFAIGNVLAHLQNYSKREQLNRKKSWQPLPFRDICDTAWLIIGYGSIGKEIDKRITAFGASIKAVRKEPNNADPAYVSPPDRLAQLVPNSDVIVLACSLTDETKNLVDKNFLKSMKPGSTLVNIGRGALIVDEDLLAALDNPETVNYAILDVFREEPLPSHHPYWNHNRVLVSSHNASFGEGMPHRADQLFLENLRRFINNEELLKEVKKS